MCWGRGATPIKAGQVRQSRDGEEPGVSENKKTCVGGWRSRKVGGRAELSVRGWVTDGLWAMVRTMDFILKAAFGWEVVCFKNTTLRGEQPGAWKQGQQSRGHHRGAEEDGGGLVQSVSGKGGGKGMELGYVLQAEEM